jgi:hypothetical protein
MKKKKPEYFKSLKECMRYIPTADDWHPCFFENALGKLGSKSEEFFAPMVEGAVRLSQVNINRWAVRFAFWGNDDTYIGRWIYFDNEQAAYDQYFRSMSWLCNLAIVQRNELVRLGFNYD